MHWIIFFMQRTLHNWSKIDIDPLRSGQRVHFLFLPDAKG